MKRVITFIIFIFAAMLTLASTHASPKTATPTQEPVWVVNPTQPGPDLPPAGRSLFDELYSRDGKYQIPFPFSRVVAELRSRLTPENTDSVRQVLIPLGRSLQRNAGAPDFFKYPRLVVAVEGETRPGEPLLRDRIYLGYHEKAAVIEAISYNEDTGRFEYQVVHNYRQDAAPQVIYARRNLCLACHQNASPLFARPLWSETNANDAIQQRLRAEHKDFYGAPLNIGVDIPNAIDDATDRANLLSAYQLLWREGCGGSKPTAMQCRAAAIKLAIQYRLSGNIGFDQNNTAWRDTLLPAIRSSFQARWRGGLAIPDSDIPNRNPLTTGITPENDPLRHRDPIAVWDSDIAAKNLVYGIADMFTAHEITAIDHALANRKSSTHDISSMCTVEQGAARNTEIRLSINCQPDNATGFGLRGRVFMRNGRLTSGTLDALELPGQPAMASIQITSGVITAKILRFVPIRDARNTRDTSGQRVVTITIPVSQTPSSASLQLRDEFNGFNTVMDELADKQSEALNDAPIRRSAMIPAIFSGLGIPTLIASPKKFPTPQIDLAQELPKTSSIVTAFRTQCGQCHNTREAFPPNFLNGNEAQVQAQISQCAERIYYRLSMWNVDEAARGRTPMPPTSALQSRGIAIDEWINGNALTTLRQHASTILGSRTSGLLSRPFDSLAPCPPASGNRP
ncbi:hypothetical protein [Sulfurirhabdus autotrophica]|uniref:Cytochrome c domain-containing protein n=1 Tax=Sulfurirhabdus autotrophica TaxID=1706046 RepID=A0A4R3YFD1_9PROT|nr:hypothetical protein [Sulfurirhabdus autotrophica]TCV90622.1 hypothetical protein EDC63_101596 [Sulfurirhabdus autotrophica]